MRDQAGLEEMQRVQSAISDRIEKALASQFEPPPGGGEAGPEPLRTVFIVLSALGTHMLLKPEEGEQLEKWNWADTALEQRKRALDEQTRGLAIDLDSLGWMLKKYEEKGGNETVLEFYRYRFTAVTVWLDSLSLVDPHHQVREFFKPKERRVFMMPK